MVVINWCRVEPMIEVGAQLGEPLGTTAPLHHTYSMLILHLSAEPD